MQCIHLKKILYFTAHYLNVKPSGVLVRGSRFKQSVDCCLILHPFKHDKFDSVYIDDRSQIQVHTDEQAQVHSVRSSSVVTHDPSTY